MFIRLTSGTIINTQYITAVILHNIPSEPEIKYRICMVDGHMHLATESDYRKIK